jgi:hypothetical protein
MNLFFVHTPIQLLIAQNLVNKLQLKNNHLVLGYSGSLGKNFYETFDILFKEDLWEKKYDIGDISYGNIKMNSYFKSIIRFKKFDKRLNSIVKKQNFDNIYFGDINHFAYLYIAEKYKFNRNFFFFEEGLSHYSSFTLRKKFNKSLPIKIKSFMLDLNYIFYGVKKFSYYFYSTQNVTFRFNMVERFTIISQNLKGYKYVPFDLLSTEKLDAILLEEANKINSLKENIVLYLSTSTSFEFSNPESDEEYLLDLFIKKIKAESSIVLIKFHPKDQKNKKDFIKNYFNSKGIVFLEILSNYKLPIEVIYNKLKVNFVIGYDSSSLLYSQSMQPDTKVVSMLPNLLIHYSNNGIKNNIIKSIWHDFDSAQLTLFNKSLETL